MTPLKNIDQLTAVVNEMPSAAVEELLELAQTAPIEILNPPKSGLTMMRVRDAFDSEFLLGEVLVTSAEVGLAGDRGFGMVPGEDGNRALARACAEVILQGENELLRTRLEKLLERENRWLQAQRTREAQLIAATRVNFELMAGQ